MSNLGKWQPWYKDMKERRSYGDALTYRMAANFLGVCDTVDDWGCGGGAFKTYLPSDVSYYGIDGTNNPFVSEIADLVDFKKRAEGILLRHVLEHNNQWKQILQNALESFEKRFCLVCMGEFVEIPYVFTRMPSLDNVPTWRLNYDEVVAHWCNMPGILWAQYLNLHTSAVHKLEHVFCLLRTNAE